MSEFIQLCLSFPTIVYSFLLTVALGYWVVVTIGGFDFDGGGGLDVGGDAVGAEGVGGDGAGWGEGDATVASSLDLLSWLRIRRAPASVVISVWVLIAWAACVLLVRPIGGALGTMMPSTLVGAIVLALAGLASAPVAVLVSSPLGSLFVVHRARAGNQAWVGKSVVVQTSVVDERSGQGLLDLGAETHLLPIRSAPEDELRKGDLALLVAYDEGTSTFRVRRLEARSGGA